MAILDTIQGPADVKKLEINQLKELAQEIRERLIAVTSQNGGHIGPNLGVVELTLALHYVFNSPADRFVFDVSHQGYVHKLLTGRNNEQFDKIRTGGGLSGFLCRSESKHDHFGAGHAGTALSAALGMAHARDLRGGKEHVVAVIGDAALTCGITMEALNNLSSSARRMVVILNDNEWSIDKNVGAISRYLNELLSHPVYNRLDKEFRSLAKNLPGGTLLLRMSDKARRETKDFFVPGSTSMFEHYGLRYLGPADGHNLEGLIKLFEFARAAESPIFLHLITKKGKGFEVAIQQPEKFHGTTPFDPETGKSRIKAPAGPPAYQDVMGEALVRFAKEDPKIVGITAAMPSGTGLKHLRDELPGQYLDVGIAEEHAVLLAGGMATDGVKPVCAIYSTFLQRSVDPIIHDICLQDLPVSFCMDRAGLSPNDGPTHHGLFDIAYLRGVPNAIVMQPKDEDELVDMVWTSIQTPHPTFVRYPRGAGEGVAIKEKPENIALGQAEVLRDGTEAMIWALGPWVQEAISIAEELEASEGLSIGVVNARFAKPLDTDLLLEHARAVPCLVTMEDHVLAGGFGSAVLECLSDWPQRPKVVRIGWPDSFVGHGSSVGELRKAHGLDRDTVRERVQRAIRPSDPAERKAVGHL